MIDHQRLLDDLKPLLKQMEADLRARCDEVAEIDAGLQREYQQARAADRTGATFEEWRADLITQVAVAWVLSCVFVRFLEDNGLISPPRISGPLHGAGEGRGMMRARDERDLYFKSHPKDTDRDYLLAVFVDLAKLPGTKDVFGPHNPVNAYRNWLSGDAAQKLIEFFQKIDTDGTGEIIHDFTDSGWDTRFLGDLYQDLSEAARKKYALLQTPVFVEEFILERTLEPAIKEFGLAGFKMVDPACGSGHFLLGAFDRILARWRRQEPGSPDRELVNRALAAIHGIDLNPYAVAIARFRLLVAAMRECRITKLKDAPVFEFSLVCGDSLLHGSPGNEQQVLGFHELAHAYQSEDLPELKRILRPGSYHAVVANPPYITVKDKALNEAYRERYPEVCHMKYSLSVPFFQRLFVLAVPGGFTGQITANSFMKREFGKKLVESYLPKIDLTYVVDTQLAHIPGHATPTVILLGRNRTPISSMVRLVSAIRCEDPDPVDPATGLVWTSILSFLDQPGSANQFISVSETARSQFLKHPWSIGGGGAAELKTVLDDAAATILAEFVESIGPSSFPGLDDIFVAPEAALRRNEIPPHFIRPLVVGEDIRDWQIARGSHCLFPYDSNYDLVPVTTNARWGRYIWPYRACSEGMISFNSLTRKELNEPWWSWYRMIAKRFLNPQALLFSEVTTHAHFVFDAKRRAYKQTSHAVKLKPSCGERNYRHLEAILNSAVACFWLKQVCHCKGGSTVAGGIKSEPWERFYAINGTKVVNFPIPEGDCADSGMQMAQAAAEAVAPESPDHLAQFLGAGRSRLDAGKEQLSTWSQARRRMIAIQEELDWYCYQLYGLIDEDLRHNGALVPIELGQRAFEIILARQIAARKEDSTWLGRHGATPTIEIPVEWPEDYKRVVQRRIEIIENDRNIDLIERPEYKRRWNTEPWDQQQVRALKNWLLDRLEGHFDSDGRMSGSAGQSQAKAATAQGELVEPRLISVAKVADMARRDKEFMQVAELYAGRMDFDVANLVGELVATESVPALPILRYKPSGLDKRTAWERTWNLQRVEDAVDALFEIERLKKVDASKAEAALRPVVQALRIDDQHKPAVLRDLVCAAGYVAEAAKQHADLANELILKPITDAAKRAKKTAIGDIPVPPKYVGADFLSSDFWRLRGKLDVPKERWVSFPHCEGEDGTLVIAWAGYDHLQLARAIAERYELAKEQEGRKLVPLLAAIGQLIPWLKQWHNELDPAFGTRMGDYFEGYLAEEAKAMGKSMDEVMAWTPPEKAKIKKRRGDQ